MSKSCFRKSDTQIPGYKAAELLFIPFIAVIIFQSWENGHCCLGSGGQPCIQFTVYNRFNKRPKTAGKWVHRDKQLKLEWPIRPFFSPSFLSKCEGVLADADSFSFWFSLFLHLFPLISLFCFWWQTLISSSLTWFIHLNLSAIKQLCPWGI